MPIPRVFSSADNGPSVSCVGGREVLITAKGPSAADAPTDAPRPKECVGDIAAAVGESARKVASAAQEVDKSLKAVYDAIDTDHTVAILIANLTEHSFELTKEAHKRGSWVDDPALGHNVLPPAQMGSWQLAGCLTNDSGDLTGTKGKLHFTTQVGGDKHYGVFR